MSRTAESKSTSWKHKLGLSNRPEAQPKFNGHPDDLVIVVVGLTGAGKSSLIRDLTGNASIVLGHQLEPCTRHVSWYRATVPSPYTRHLGSRRLILVDTPGFNDGHLDEPEVLRQVSRWLAQSYDANKAVTGIVYLNDISLQQIFKSSRIDLPMITKLCGETRCKKVVLATSKWDCLADTRVGDQHEQELRENLWGAAVERGAKVMRIERKPVDAHAIVSYLLESRPGSETRQIEESGKNFLDLAVSIKPCPTITQADERPSVERYAMDTPRSDDIIIAIMGQAGAGKSTFINGYLGERQAEVGNSLGQCTRHISRYTASTKHPQQGGRIVLVDTPGLDDQPNEHDNEILRRLAIWIATSCSTGASLAGVLYLQDIKQKRGKIGAPTHLKDFKRLARISFNNSSLEFTTALVTTQWDEVEQEAGIRREEELKSSIWKDLIDEGASVYRVDRDGCQGWIVKQVLGWPRAV